jgi:hypothetical protein
MPFPSYIRTTALLLALGLLAGCAGVTRVPLDKNASAKFNRVESDILIPADELIVRAKPSNLTGALGGGLIPALIDASVTSSRQTELEVVANPFYEKTDALDFRSLFSESFKASFNDQTSLPNLNISVSSRGLSKTAVEERRAKLKPDEAFMGMRIWYEFTPDTRSVVVGAGTLIAAPGGAENSYKNSFIYISKPLESAHPLEAWAENDGKALAAVFTESAKEIAHMLKQDLQAPDNEALFASLAQQEKIKFTIPSFMPVTISGFLTEQTEQRKIIRAESGELFSVSK